MSELKIIDWIDPDENESITLADIQAASREAADRIAKLEAQLAEARKLLIHADVSAAIPMRLVVVPNNSEEAVQQWCKRRDVLLKDLAGGEE